VSAPGSRYVTASMPFTGRTLMPSCHPRAAARSTLRFEITTTSKLWRASLTLGIRVTVRCHADVRNPAVLLWAREVRTNALADIASWSVGWWGKP
jgi:hypothetical protein